MKYYLFLVGLVIQTIAWAQPTRKIEKNEDDILNCSSYRIGIYKAFEEFRINSPSILQEFTFSKAHYEPSKTYLESEKDRLKLLDPRGRTSRVLDRIWGFCDSTGVYIYFEDRYQLGRRYNRLRTMGRYCYFVDEYDMAQKAGERRPKHIQREYVLNMNDGNAYEFNVDALKRILAKDPELLRRFDMEKNPEAVMVDYLNQFNNRNQELVKAID